MNRKDTHGANVDFMITNFVEHNKWYDDSGGVVGTTFEGRTNELFEANGTLVLDWRQGDNVSATYRLG